MAMRNIFSGMKNAPVMNQGTYMQPGRYWYRIDKVKCAESGFKKKSFVAVETTVVRVLAPYLDIKVQPLGDTSTHMMMDGDAIQHQYFISDVKKFLAGAFGVKPEEVDDIDILQASGMKVVEGGLIIEDMENGVQKQPMRGMVLEYYNRPHTTGKNVIVTKHAVERAVPPAEVLTYFQASARADLERFFPGNFLQSVIAATATAAK